MKKILFLLTALLISAGCYSQPKSRAQIKTDIDANIYTNTQHLITGGILNGILKEIADSYCNEVTDSCGYSIVGPGQVAYGNAGTGVLTSDNTFTHSRYATNIGAVGVLRQAIATVDSNHFQLLFNGVTNTQARINGSELGLYVTNHNNNFWWPQSNGVAGTALVDTDGSGHLSFEPISNSAWGTLGNTGTDQTTNFIGNTDNVSLWFKINNYYSGLLSSLESGGGNTTWGYATIDDEAFGKGAQDNSAFGLYSQKLRSTGTLNTSVGAYALQNDTSGNLNTAIGAYSQNGRLRGGGNTSLGTYSLQNDTIDNNNVAIGYASLQDLYTGSRNTAVGNATNILTDNISNSIAIGYAAKIGASNCGVLGDSSINISWGIGYSTPSVILGGNTGLAIRGDLYVSGTITNSATPTISTGATAPASTPDKVGDLFIDTVGMKLYFSVGTSSSADWIIAN